MQEPEILLDVVTPSPQQQKIVDLVGKIFVGIFILWNTTEELTAELKAYRNETAKPITTTASLS